MKMFNNLYRILWLFLLLVLTIMGLLTILDISLRTFIGSGVPGTVETCAYLLVMMVFLGVGPIQKEGGHIEVELLSKLMKEKKIYLNMTSLSICILFSALFAYSGYLKAISTFWDGETAWFGNYILPVWFFRWVYPIGFFVLCVQFILDLKKEVKEYFLRKTE